MRLALWGRKAARCSGRPPSAEGKDHTVMKHEPERVAAAVQPTSHSLRQFVSRNRRRVLLVFPRYSPSFGTFQHAFPLLDVAAFMPPQGLLLIGALLPHGWDAKFVDENLRQATPDELAWAEVVFISGMHIQRAQIHSITQRAHAVGKLTVLGGPSVSAAPEFYPEVDVLHCGEAGDATLQLFEHLDASVARPEKQLVFRTADRLSLTEFPCPAYHLARLDRYMLGSIQFSSGCPFTCEFCDIPALYGRNPRLKTPAQVLEELDQLLAGGWEAAYFVDDNFIANPKATLELLPHLVGWQKARGYRLRLACEATLNLASHPQILALMREAFFVTVFCGIETPEPAALRAMHKTQNLRAPILESVATLNRYGLEVASGIIMGLDTDTSETPQAIIDFARQSHIPLLTVNLLYALPHTPLYARMQQAGRIVPDEGRDSNIAFLEPYETVVNRWKQVISELYEPANLYARFAAQAIETYPNRIPAANSTDQLTWKNLKRLMRIVPRLFWRVGVRSAYRRHFWRLAWRQVRRGNVESVFHVAVVAHHLITYSRECVNGAMQSSNYSRRAVDEPAVNRVPPVQQPEYRPSVDVAD